MPPSSHPSYRLAVLSRSEQLYSTQSLVRAAHSRGHQVMVVDHMFCGVWVEQQRPGVFYHGQTLPPPDGVIPRIGASVTIHGAAVIRQLESMGVFTATRSEALLRARDKLQCLQELALGGIEVPRTFFVTQPYELEALLDVMGGPPVVIKLLESTHGMGVILAENRNTALSIVEAFSRTRERILVQEYIAESRGADIRAFVVGGQIVAAMKRQAVSGEFRSNLHRGATASLVELTPHEEEVVLKSAHLMGLHIAGVDLLRSDRGPLVMEVNASPGLEGIETTTGVDIAGAIVEFMEQSIEHARGPYAL